MYLSRVPIPIHVDESKVEANLSPDLVESSVGLVMIFDDISVGAIAEWSIGWVFAITKFVISALVNVEADGPVSGYSCITSSITTWIT